MTAQQTAPLHIEPDIGVPFCPQESYIDLRKKVEAACNTLGSLEDMGLEFDLTAEDQIAAEKAAMVYAEDSTKGSAPSIYGGMSDKPASLRLCANILDEFHERVVDKSVHIRNMVTNKLILESENPDARVRLRALELLGKVSDVGLFADKTEVTVTHQTTSEIKEKLRAKLHRLVHPDEEADVTDAVTIDQEPDQDTED